MREGELLAGKYRVKAVLAEGGMGVVVAATHTKLDQPVALKFMLPDLASDDDAVRRFLREARAAARLRSEHAARILDVCELDSGDPYIVMELLEGGDLSLLISTTAPMRPRTTPRGHGDPRRRWSLLRGRLLRLRRSTGQGR